MRGGGGPGGIRRPKQYPDNVVCCWVLGVMNVLLYALAY